MPTATFRFHGSLRDFLPAGRRDLALEYAFEGTPGAKDAIEALGVPHPEVDLIEANGRAVDLGYRLRSGDRIEVFGLDRPVEPSRPAESSIPVEPSTGGLIPPPPFPPRFVLDGHLGRLARYLRMLGFDSRYDRSAADDELARQSAEEERVLLTRDRGLLKRSIVRLGYLVRDDDPRRQLVEVVTRYGLAPLARPFSRCVRCNGEIEPVDRAAVVERLAGEPRTLRYFDAFGRCAGCGAIYWQGSHFDRMSRLVADVVRTGSGMGDNRPTPQARMEGDR
jgi:uncharacterized protein with PIN domain